MTIDLSDEERALLSNILEVAHNDLREEIYKTEDTDFKRVLKERQERLQSLIAKVSEG
jgi:hypothetical protein